MDRLDPRDTIAAPATPSSAGVLGLIRLSGPNALTIASVGFEDSTGKPPPSRPESRSGRLTVDGLRRPVDASILFWPGPRSYTGQPLAEVQTLGSPPILAALLAHYLSKGARLAEPGEFTLRAFLSGRIDLTQSEAVLAVIDAGNPSQLDAALTQLAGGLAGPIHAARDQTLDLLAHLEANLDFAEESDVDPLGREILASTLDQAAETIERLASRFRSRDRTETLARVVLIGAPNAGKSRLFNALAGAEQAIVSPTAGTTRDYLTARCECDGLVVELVDTAGIEPSRSSIENQARNFREQQSDQADIRLFCISSDSDFPDSAEAATLLVRTKSDLLDPSSERLDGLLTSAATGAGLVELRQAIAAAIRAESGDGSGIATTGARCKAGLDRAGNSLRLASETLRAGGGDELVAVDLRQVVDDLGRIVGAVVTDDVLDRIFRKFCIGK